MHKGGRLKGKMIKPVTFLNTRDIESLEAIIQEGKAWPDLLTRKHTELYVDESFHNYIYRAFGGAIPRNGYLQARWERIVDDKVGMRFFGQTLDHSAAAWRRHPRQRRWKKH